MVIIEALVRSRSRPMVGQDLGEGAGRAFYMGMFGEFENVGITIGPVLGGLVWCLAGIQAAFYAYAAAALLAAVAAWVLVPDRTREGVPVG